MSSENIEIVRQNSNGYDTFYPVTNAQNVIDNNSTILENVQAMANGYISLDAVYWEDIAASKVFKQTELSKTKIYASEHPYICNCESFYCLFLIEDGASSSSPALIKMYYSFDVGETWTKYNFYLPSGTASNTFYILGAEAMLTSTGYDVVFIGSCGLTSSYPVYTYRIRFPDHKGNSPLVNLFNDTKPYYSTNTRLYKTYRGIYMVDGYNQLKYCPAAYNANSNNVLYDNFSWVVVLKNLDKGADYIIYPEELADDADVEAILFEGMLDGYVDYILFDSVVRSKPLYMLCDKTIDTIYFYLENGNFLFYAPYNLSQSTLIENDLTLNVTNVVCAFNKAFMVSSDGYLYYYYRNDNEDDNYQTNFSLDKITLPSGHTWKYVFGNDYKLYIIDSNGVLAYIQSIDDEWHYANQSEPSAITQWQTLNSFDMQSAQFCASKKNDAVMGLFTDTNNEVSFARAYCGNYR